MLECGSISDTNRRGYAKVSVHPRIGRCHKLAERLKPTDKTNVRADDQRSATSLHIDRIVFCGSIGRAL